MLLSVIPDEDCLLSSVLPPFRYNQINAISLACRTGLKECQDLAVGWFKEWMVTGKNM